MLHYKNFWEVNKVEKKTSIEYSSNQNIAKVIDFLSIIMTITLAKRIVCIILLSSGIAIEEIVRSCGLCKTTVYDVRNKLQAGEIHALFKVGGGGNKSPLTDVETEIIDEINKNEYFTQQQIVDMVQNKFNITTTTHSIGRFLKKKSLKS